MTFTVPTITTRPLRSYQEVARDDVLEVLEAHDRALYVSACGTGKTITLQAIASSIASEGLVGAFFPSLFLVGQTLREWLVQYENRWATPIVVCSDPTVVRKKIHDDDDENELSPAEIAAMGALVTTSPVELADMLRHRFAAGETHRPQVVFATYQSSDKVAEAQAILVNEGVNAAFDVAVFDEAHRITPGTALGEHVLDAEKILAHKRVSATATPRQFHVSDDGDRADNGDLLDESIYGPIAHEYGLRQAIDDGVLADYRIHATVIPQEDLVLAENVDDAEMRLHLGIAALRCAEEQYGAGRAIAYLANVKRAQRFAAMARAENLNAHVITGDVPTAEREEIMAEAFVQSDSGVVANVKCLTEGVDVPALDAVVFVDPRKNKVDIVQAVGRAIRRAPGKTFGRVIIPILAGEGDADTWMHQAGWDTLTSVLAQMADNDTGLRTALIEQSKCTPSRQRDRDGAAETIVANPAEPFVVDYHLTPNSAERALNEPPIVPLGDMFQRFLQRTALTAVRAFNVDWAWDEKLEGVIEFVRLNERLPKTRAPQPEGGLGAWLAVQRRDYATGTMSPTRDRLLNEGVAGWLATQGSDLAWMKYLNGYVAFIENNDRRPNARAEGVDERRLASWLNRQRTPPRLGRGVTPTQKKMLDERLSGWDLSADQIWQNNLNAAVEYALNHGKMPPQQAKEPEAKRLGTWLSNQRAQKHMPPRRRAQLDDHLPGWEITPRNEKFWLTKLELFVTFIEQHGCTPSRVTGGPDERMLENWMRVQRGGRNLSPERRALLDTRVPGWDLVGVGDEVWQGKLTAVVTFTRREMRMPSQKAQAADEKELGTWVETQRRNTSSISQERRAALDAQLPGWGSHRNNNDEWFEKLKALKAFVQVNGRIPTQKDADYSSRTLRHWLDTQRRTRSLLPERKALLDEYFPTWNAQSIRESVWEGRLDQVKEFRDLYARMPSVKDSDPAAQKLARWLATQRHRPDLVTSSRREQLDERLPGWETRQPQELSHVRS